MATTLPMLQSYKNVTKLFDKIKAAKQPDVFTHRFLSDTLGLKSVGDRPLVAFLRSLGFLDANNKPTSEYGKLKNEREAAKAIGKAIRKAFGPLFASNELANSLPQDQLRGLVAQVAGTDSNNTTKILGTLNALIKIADFSEETAEAGGEQPAATLPPTAVEEDLPTQSRLKTEFHYNIQIHLPANGSEEMYLNIFNALRRVFK